MSDLVPFKFNNTKLVTITINGKHWIRAKEICKALEYKRRAKDVLREHVYIYIYTFIFNFMFVCTYF